MTRATRPGRARTLLLALASLAVAACKTGLEVPEGALVTCGSDADCPGGYICRSTLGRCVRPGGDVTAPELVTASLQVDPPLVGTATATVTVAFEVSEPLASDPVAFLRLSGAGATTRALAVQSRDLALNRYVLSYSPAPASDGEGDVSFVATFIDAAGNEGHVELPRVAVFDFTAPRLARDTGGAAVVAVALTPPATSPRRDVDAITVGTRVRVDFAASEPLAGGAGSPVVKLASGGNAVTLTQLSGNTLSYVYETVMGAGFIDGPASLTAHLTDLAGNVADVPLATVQVKTQRPASPAVGTAGAVLFHRVPWGSDATGGAEAYYLRGAAGAVPASTLAVVYSDPTVISSGGTLVGREIARVAASVTGAFGGDVGDAAPFPLYMGDSPDVYVAAVDGAGNVSDADGDPSNGIQAALVRDVAWTATMLGKIPGRVFPNPHAFEGRQVWTPTLAQRGSKPASVPADVGRPDGTQASVRGAPHWLPARRYGTLGPRGGVGMAYDPVRGCRVAFSGEGWDGCDSGFYCSQWESCRGGAWGAPAIDDPEGDGNPALAPRLPLLFVGGRGASVLADGTDLWEWNGTSWRKLVMTDPEGDGNPSPRRNHAIAYDEARQRLVLFGGSLLAGGAALGDTWETDFRSWRRVCTGAPCTSAMPAARSEHTMVYDPVRKVTLLVGGVLANGTSYDTATWTWNGSAWTPCSTAACVNTSPAQRKSASLTFDSGRGKAVAFGGITSIGMDGGLFEWNGTGWTAVCTAAPCSTTRPEARAHASFFYDLRSRPHRPLRRRRRRLRPAASAPATGATPSGSGTGAPGARSSARGRGAAVSVSGVTPVYNPVRDRVVLFGGQEQLRRTRAPRTCWDGASGRPRARLTVPPARDELRCRVGAVGRLERLRLDGQRRGRRRPDRPPPPGGAARTGAATARSPPRGPRSAKATSPRSPAGAVLFGGRDGSGHVSVRHVGVSLGTGAWAPGAQQRLRHERGSVRALRARDDARHRLRGRSR